MNPDILLPRVMALCQRAHAGQFDKSGEPYYLHPLRVGLATYHYTNEDTYLTAAIAGCLHDAVEDSDLTLDDLRREGVPDPAVRVVGLLTRGDDEDYDTYQERVLADPIACVVKLCDVEDNLRVSRLGPEITEKDKQRLEHYRGVRKRLLAKINERSMQ